ncbi:MAG: signal peptidase II [Clostridia bacterium]|nr:signal peptidase II [Clostridia bacterium]
MKCRSVPGRLIAAFAVGLILLADVFSKRWALTHLLSGGAREGIKGLFHFRFAWNTGVAFSFLSDKPVIVILFTGVILTVIALFLFLPKRERLFDRLCLSLIFAGGLGNLIDRICYGAVADFIEFSFVSFPVFNFADVCVVLGTCLYAARMLIWDKRKGGFH